MGDVRAKPSHVVLVLGEEVAMKSAAPTVAVKTAPSEELQPRNGRSAIDLTSSPVKSWDRILLPCQSSPLQAQGS